jgi:hypothetical protein
LPQDAATPVLYGSTDDVFLALSGGDLPASTPLTLGSAGLTVALTFQLPSAFPTAANSMTLFNLGFGAQGSGRSFALGISVSSTGALRANWAEYVFPASGGMPLYFVGFNSTLTSSGCAVAWGAWSTVALTVDASGTASLYASGNQSALATSNGAYAAHVAFICRAVALAVAALIYCGRPPSTAQGFLTRLILHLALWVPQRFSAALIRPPMQLPCCPAA